MLIAVNRSLDAVKSVCVLCVCLWVLCGSQPVRKNVINCGIVGPLCGYTSREKTQRKLKKKKEKLCATHDSTGRKVKITQKTDRLDVNE